MGGATSQQTGSPIVSSPPPEIKFHNLEHALQTINAKYIFLPEGEVATNKEILEKIVEQILKHMIREDELFSNLFNRIFYGGSYYDDLRVGQPSEFDLDLLMKIPRAAKPELTISNVPGYVKIKIGNPDFMGPQFKKRMLGDNDNFLNTKKIKSWMQGVWIKAMNNFIQPNSSFEAKLSQSGPAMTLKIWLQNSTNSIDIDFVPCFEFGKEFWPVGGYTQNPVPRKATFFIVPKSPKKTQVRDNFIEIDRFWRLSFQEQERELIKGKRFLKPALKLIKKLRDVQEHKKIASYFIKTIFLLEDKKHGDSFWHDTLSGTFLKMLDAYVKYVSEENIPYFWNRKNNLLCPSCDREKQTLNNLKNHLRRIQKDIVDNKEQDPAVVVKYLVTDNEMYKLCENDEDETPRTNQCTIF